MPRDLDSGLGIRYNEAVDEFQAREYPTLQGKAYLDHGGTTIYAKSLIKTFANDLASNLYGNPHSMSTPAKLSGQVVDDTREKTLRFFGADPEFFDLIFVANATAAIKLVMESFKDISLERAEGSFWYGYHVDSHNSIIGVRECTDGDHHCFSTDTDVEKWLSGAVPLKPTKKLGLFAYPGQSNMTGRRLSLSWPGQLRNSWCESHQYTYSLLDAAALATTYPLNRVFHEPDKAPDFTVLSFYKIFGFPDLGGLIVRKASSNILRCRKYFGGGTVSVVTVLGDKIWHESRDGLHDTLEDGTLPFHSIIALDAAIKVHRQLYGDNPMLTISRHTSYLAKRLFDSVSSLRHYNGRPVCELYTDRTSKYGDSTTQGATLSFNILQADGMYVPYTSSIEKLADEHGIYVRSGQLCNPGGIAKHLHWQEWQIKALVEYGHKCGDAEASGTEIFEGKPTGVVRVSLGAMTTKGNVDAFVTFLEDNFTTWEAPTPEFDLKPISSPKISRVVALPTSPRPPKNHTSILPRNMREKEEALVRIIPIAVNGHQRVKNGHQKVKNGQRYETVPPSYRYVEIPRQREEKIKLKKSFRQLFIRPLE